MLSRPELGLSSVGADGLSSVGADGLDVAAGELHAASAASIARASRRRFVMSGSSVGIDRQEPAVAGAISDPADDRDAPATPVPRSERLALHASRTSGDGERGARRHPLSAVAAGVTRACNGPPPATRAIGSAAAASFGPSTPLHHTGAASTNPPTQGVLMIRLPTLDLEDAPAEDRSMRVIEYVLALSAIVAAGILAFVR
jgi:hypothetical protein